MNAERSAGAPPIHVAWLVWGMGALLYFVGFFHRVAPAVMTGELMREFNISAVALGNLASFYFYSYVAMQIPTGILADTIGPRRLLSLGAVVAAIGAIVFAIAPNLAWAGVGRLLIGGSVAVAFVGMLKLAGCWFPMNYYAMVSGMAVTCGVLGGIMAGPPLRLFMNQFGWRSAMMIVAGLTLGVAALIHGLARDNPSEKGYADRLPVCRVDRHFSIGAVAAGMAEIFHYRNSWLLLVIPGSMTGSVLSFCGLWGVPFLTTHYGMTPAKAAVLASAMMVSMAAGGLCFGWLSDRSGKRKPLFLLGCFGALVPFSVALLIEGLPIPILVAALLIASFCANAVVITFAIAKESVPARLSGTISGMVNMGTMSGPMILQPAIGWMLDFKWHGHMEAGVRIYSFEAYRAGFSLMLAWLLLSLVLLIFIRETHCRQIV